MPPMAETLTDDELDVYVARARECQHQRGAQGVWARRFLALYATMDAKISDAHAVYRNDAGNA